MANSGSMKLYAVVSAHDGVEVGHLRARWTDTGFRLDLAPRDGSPELMGGATSALRAACGETTDTPPVTDNWAAIENVFAQRGFALREIQPQVLTTSVSIDALTGESVGETGAASGELLDATASVANSVFRAISRIGPNLAARALNEVRQAVKRNDHSSAWKALVNWQESGGLVLGGGATDAHAATLLVNPAELDVDSRKELLLLRSVLAGMTSSYTPQLTGDISALRAEFGDQLSAQQEVSLRMLEANIAATEHRRETAYILWRGVIVDAEGASERAWAHHNISRAHPADSPESARHAEFAADAFLEAGRLQDAAKEYIYLTQFGLAEDPGRCVEMLDEALTWFSGDRPEERHARAQLMHSKACAFQRLGQLEAAMALHLAVEELMRPLHGTTGLRIASLGHAHILAANLGRSEDAAKLKAQCESLISHQTSPDWRRRRAAARLLESYSSTEAREIAAEALASGDTSVYSSTLILRAQHEGTPSEKIAWLDEALAISRRCEASREDLRIALSAMGNELAHQGQHERALTYFREALGLDPLDRATRQKVGATLFKLGRWKDAIAFLEEQQRIFGELPGILCALGRAHFEVGDFGKAIPLFAKVRRMTPPDSQEHKTADDFEAQSYAAGGKPDAYAGAVLAPEPPLSLRELRLELQAFARYVQSEQRRTFWSKRKWRPSPEQHARTLLETFLAARLDGRVEQLREIEVGAGRMDLYVVGRGGFRCVVELKMLGGGYSTTYAFSGREQIVHYLENKGVHAGILVVFDGRKRDVGKGLTEVTKIGDNVIYSYFVDVRMQTK
ncbi:MAG: tetratricopeptide repeat protein [Polyangiaceae bacterium]|nr:tetratricopeptide repeat protein [Polyangiaceae bacterium]